MNDLNASMNTWIRRARGYVPAEDEQPAEQQEQPKRPGDANGGAMALLVEPPDMNDVLRRAVSRARFGHDGTQPGPIRRT